jgi:NAD(P)-dependent dehydrogenase (short-subunit alcohol dehydrogenase family)
MVVVNDVGGSVDGTGGDGTPAQSVCDEIAAFGARAVANYDNVASWEGAQRLVNQAIETFGDLHVVINNAGILRDRVLVNMTEEEWDAVIAVHLKGTFGPSRWAAAYWREKAKAGEQLDNRIINTSSVSGIYGNPGQTNYGAAKAGIAAFTQIAARELIRYGVTVNAIAPGALTRMTEGLAGMAQDSEEEREMMHPHWVAPVAVWLASPQSKGITGRVFEASGRVLAIAEGWHRGPTTTPVDDPSDIDRVLRDLLAKSRPNADMSGQDKDW